MPQILILPNAKLCPQGAAFEAETGESILDAALRNGVEIEHACEKSCACTTCHVLVREGYDSLEPADELEDDYLDKAWGAGSRFPVGLPGSGRHCRSGCGNTPVYHQHGVRKALISRRTALAGVPLHPKGAYNTRPVF